jgi:acyl carrier protein
MTETLEQVISEVTRIVRQLLNDETIQLKYETTANEVKGWDSLQHIEIVLAVEKHFRIRFNFSELQKFKNVGQMCDNVVAKITKAKATP